MLCSSVNNAIHIHKAGEATEVYVSNNDNTVRVLHIGGEDTDGGENRDHDRVRQVRCTVARVLAREGAR